MKKILIMFVFAFFLVSSVYAANDSYCCEKTTSGAWCQNAPLTQCDSSFKTSPTSCDSTSYCKRGCCFDSQEGICMENTAQRVCADSGGTWANDSKCEVPQCNLGCCVLADQGAFVTLARCKAISGFYGLTTDFRKNIGDELSCIAVAQAEDKGACVFEDSATLQKTCTFTTRGKCPTASLTPTIINTSSNSSSVSNASSGFYKDVLCSAEELGTNCAPSTKTMLISGKDEVYFMDTCNQPANIYDASKINDKSYWKNVFKKSESCGYGSSNANSKSCGNCDYYLGSIGKKSTFGNSANYGDYICADLSCKDSQGNKRQHGESWCVIDSPSGNGQDPVGSRYFKQVCLNNEILTEPCADFRQEICIEDNFNGFSEAACRVNRWQDCIKQEEQADCENYDQRDCKWISGYYFSSNTQQVEKSVNESQAKKLGVSQTPDGVCVAYYPPGLIFWGATSKNTGTSTSSFTSNATSNFPQRGTGYVSPTSAGTSASSQCSLGNAKITFKWIKETKPLAFWDKGEGWECDDATGNCQYLSTDDTKNADLSTSTIENWASEMNNICYQLGDCGGYINWNNVYTDDGYAAYYNGARKAGSGGAKILEAAKKTTATTGTSTSSGSSTTKSGTTGTTPATTGTSGGTAFPVIGTTGNVIRDFIKSTFGGK